MEQEKMKSLLETNKNTPLAKDMEIHNMQFSLDGFQVARGEFFSHTYEPTFVFNKMKISVNKASIRKLPNVEYMQILINQDTQKIAVKPCSEEEKDSLRWCTSRRQPRWISCPLFFAKVMNLMNWDPGNKYKLIGKLIRSGEELLFVFDLKTPDVFIHYKNSEGKEAISKKPSYPEEWKNQFGLPVAEHQMNLQVNIFDGFALVDVHSKDESTEKENEIPAEMELDNGNE